MIEKEALNQNTYKPTPYEDSSWEIVGEFLNQEIFEPTAFDLIGEQSLIRDPMFADYGGIPNSDHSSRLHGPSGQMSSGTKRRSEKGIEEPEEDDPNRIVIMRSELEAQLAAAHQRGFEEGTLDTLSAADQRMVALDERYTNILQDISSQIRHRLDECERRAAQLAITIAQKLIHGAVEINPEYLIKIVQQAVSKAGGATIKCIKVSREDLEFIRLLNLPQQFKDYDGTWKFVADDTVRAGCIVETSAGEIDFDLNKAFERVKDAVIKAI